MPTISPLELFAIAYFTWAAISTIMGMIKSQELKESIRFSNKKLIMEMIMPAVNLIIFGAIDMFYQPTKFIEYFFTIIAICSLLITTYDLLLHVICLWVLNTAYVRVDYHEKMENFSKNGVCLAQWSMPIYNTGFTLVLPGAENVLLKSIDRFISKVHPWVKQPDVHRWDSVGPSQKTTYKFPASLVMAGKEQIPSKSPVRIDITTKKGESQERISVY